MYIAGNNQHKLISRTVYGFVQFSISSLTMALQLYQNLL